MTTEETKKNKREIIADAINAGGATRETLMAAAEVNAAGLASQFTYLRMGGMFPVEDKETKIFRFVDKTEWDAMRDAAKSNAGKPAGPKKSALERRQACEKRIAKLKTDVTKRQETFEKDVTNRENELRYNKAGIELELAEIELGAIMKEKTKAEWKELLEQQANANTSGEA